jgi:hypothetical protein
VFSLLGSFGRITTIFLSFVVIADKQKKQNKYIRILNTPKYIYWLNNALKFFEFLGKKL